MKRIQQFIPMAMLTLLLTGCSSDKEIHPTKVLEIKNNSNKVIVYKIGNIYPDTLLWKENPFTTASIADHTIESGKSAEVALYFSSYPPGFYEKTCLYFFEKNTLIDSNWDSIRDNYDILNRFDFNEDDLDRINWEILIPLQD